MSEPERDAGMDCLFSGQDMRLDNIKFHRGTDELIPKERLITEVCASVERSRKATLSRTPPRCKKAPIDLADLDTVA